MSAWGDTSASSPTERMRQSLWTLAFGGGARPKRVVDLEGQAERGQPPIWSPDSKQIILSVGYARRVPAAGGCSTRSGSTRTPRPGPLSKVRSRGSVQDWSPDGTVDRDDLQPQRQDRLAALCHAARWQRSAPGHRGWESVLRPLAHPDSRCLLYSDGTLRLPDRQGIWVIDRNGQNRRRILPTGKGTASACWSPDGQQSRSRSAGPNLKIMDDWRS